MYGTAKPATAPGAWTRHGHEKRPLQSFGPDTLAAPGPVAGILGIVGAAAEPTGSARGLLGRLLDGLLGRCLLHGLLGRGLLRRGGLGRRRLLGRGLLGHLL